MALARVIITPEVFETCMTHALTTEKEEIMGLLLGDITYDESGYATANIWIAMPQIRTDRRKDRVEASPEQLAQASSKAEQISEASNKHTRVIGWYHSHPHITVLPSHVDVRTQAMYQNLDEGFIGLIFSAFNQDASKTQKLQVTAFQSIKHGAISRFPSHLSNRASFSQKGSWELDSPMAAAISASMAEAKKHSTKQEQWTQRRIPLSILPVHGVNNLRNGLITLCRVLFEEEQHAYRDAIKQATSRNGRIDPVSAVHISAEYQQNLAKLMELVVSPSLQSIQNLHQQTVWQQGQIRELRDNLARKSERPSFETERPSFDREPSSSSYPDTARQGSQNPDLFQNSHTNSQWGTTASEKLQSQNFSSHPLQWPGIPDQSQSINLRAENPNTLSLDHEDLRNYVQELGAQFDQMQQSNTAQNLSSSPQHWKNSGESNHDASLGQNHVSNSQFLGSNPGRQLENIPNFQPGHYSREYHRDYSPTISHHENQAPGYNENAQTQSRNPNSAQVVQISYEPQYRLQGEEENQRQPRVVENTAEWINRLPPKFHTENRPLNQGPQNGNGARFQRPQQSRDSSFGQIDPDELAAQLTGHIRQTGNNLPDNFHTNLENDERRFVWPEGHSDWNDSPPHSLSPTGHSRQGSNHSQTNQMMKEIPSSLSLKHSEAKSGSSTPKSSKRAINGGIVKPTLKEGDRQKLTQDAFSMTMMDEELQRVRMSQKSRPARSSQERKSVL